MYANYINDDASIIITLCSPCTTLWPAGSAKTTDNALIRRRTGILSNPEICRLRKAAVADWL